MFLLDAFSQNQAIVTEHHLFLAIKHDFYERFLLQMPVSYASPKG